jgi:hypothetical protein
MLLNEEIARWRDFRNGLSNDDKVIFDELMNSSKLHSSASSCSLRTDVFEAMCMAIIMNHQQKLEDLAMELEKLHLGDGSEEV